MTGNGDIERRHAIEATLQGTRQKADHVSEPNCERRCDCAIFCQRSDQESLIWADSPWNSVMRRANIFAVIWRWAALSFTVRDILFAIQRGYAPVNAIRFGASLNPNKVILGHADVRTVASSWANAGRSVALSRSARC